MSEDHAKPGGTRLYIRGGSRCALENGSFAGWFVGTSPRNGYHASVEGAWGDWVRLAEGILAQEERRKRGEWDPDAEVMEDG